jgi:EAL domain-containing protein (putative c-di-GMP-specific phosphodiesterase class I)
MGNPFIDWNTIPFGRRGLAPRVCVAAGKPHVRRFLADMLEDLGFVTDECGQVDEIARATAGVAADLVVLGSLDDAAEQSHALLLLASRHFKGKIMLFGGRSSPALHSAHELGEQLGLAMLPPLGTPFRDSDLSENLSAFLPIRPPPALPVDVEEALRNGWLELWYQPKIDPHGSTLRGAEALIRIRHPHLGLILPAYFIPALGDPHLRLLSEYVVARAAADWLDFARAGTPVELAVNVPLVLLEDPTFVNHMRLQAPDHRAFTRLIVDVTAAEAVADAVRTARIASRLRDYNIALAIDNAGAEPAELARCRELPVAEFKVDWTAIRDRTEEFRRKICAPVVVAAGRFGARAVATGIETRAELQAACALGFELVQGELFAKPMERRKFARSMLRQRGAASG